jgi:hypothetical protein
VSTADFRFIAKSAADIGTAVGGLLKALNRRFLLAADQAGIKDPTKRWAALLNELDPASAGKHVCLTGMLLCDDLDCEGVINRCTGMDITVLPTKSSHIMLLVITGSLNAWNQLVLNLGTDNSLIHIRKLITDNLRNIC